jgi:ribonuclease P protein component
LKILQIKKSAEFQKIGQTDSKFFAKTLILLTKPTPEKYSYSPERAQNAENFCRVGYTVSKKVGNAVVRNFAKRRLREAFRSLATIHAKNNYDYVLIARSEIALADFAKIISDVKFCLTRIHNVRRN